MTLDPRKSPVACGVLGSWLALLAASLLPVWEPSPFGIAYHQLTFTEIEPLDSSATRRGPLWQVLPSFRTELRLVPQTPLRFLSSHLENTWVAAVALLCGALAGYAVGRLMAKERREIEAEVLER